ncbi:uncharacterized protein LOC132787810 [Drosophila nasuta]|uniref:uncharacterized protein LOC132787810 n=1 Tax=Drosophila nasuta TaxID=42062 RepID=UPI00295E816B|nr:uncharacterized protein LOC132787810 [Drosophila nasuta]
MYLISSDNGAPPRPPNLKGNQFALLSESPPVKKKRQNQKIDMTFPDLPTITLENPKYIVMASKNVEKKISDFSCIAVYNALRLISKNITSISNLRYGNLLMLVKNQSEADKFINSPTLPGICDITCKMHETLNQVKGTIYAPYLSDVSNEEIIEELRSQKVSDIFKFTKTIDNTTKPSGVILVTFDLYHLPSKIDIAWHSVKVREYIPNPMRCKSCQLLGHTAKHCKNEPRCGNCALPPHSPDNCSQTKCVNCSEEHPSSSRQCPKYQQQREILKIKTTKKCTMREAKLLFNGTTTKLSSSSSYAAVANAGHNNNGKQRNKIITKTTTQEQLSIRQAVIKHLPIPTKELQQQQQHHHHLTQHLHRCRISKINTIIALPKQSMMTMTILA